MLAAPVVILAAWTVFSGGSGIAQVPASAWLVHRLHVLLLVVSLAAFAHIQVRLAHMHVAHGRQVGSSASAAARLTRRHSPLQIATRLLLSACPVIYCAAAQLLTLPIGASARTPSSQLLWTWCVVFNVLGIFLFPNFLPWT